MLEIQNTDEIQTPRTAWFFYGATGSGKTTALATFPRPLLLVPANEGSELSLRAQRIPFVKVGKDLSGKVIPVRQHLNSILTDLEARHARMQAALRAGDELAADREFPWETIGVESLTHLGDMLVEDVSNYGLKKMDQQGWGLISTFLRTVHSRLRNMDVHVVYTSLAKLSESDGSATTGGPALIGSMAEKLPSACDVIAYMEEIPQPAPNPPIYRTFLRKYKWWQARSRFASLPPYIDAFNFNALGEQLGLTLPAPEPEPAPLPTAEPA